MLLKKPYRFTAAMIDKKYQPIQNVFKNSERFMLSRKTRNIGEHSKEITRATGYAHDSDDQTIYETLETAWAYVKLKNNNGLNR